MRKSKIAGDVAAVIMEGPSHTSVVGVRTRAKTLALQKSPPSSPQQPDSDAYLQLRSRRLRKVPPPKPPRRESNSAANSIVRESLAKTASSKGADEEKVDAAAVEASFGENFLEIEGRDRSTRESTPCSLIRDPNAAIHTPSSTTRQRRHLRRNNEQMQRIVPSAAEIEEFFSHAEKKQQAMFRDKYNFDIVNEVPLPGRYEWVPVHH